MGKTRERLYLVKLHVSRYDEVLVRATSPGQAKEVAFLNYDQPIATRDDRVEWVQTESEHIEETRIEVSTR